MQNRNRVIKSLDEVQGAHSVHENVNSSSVGWSKSSVDGDKSSIEHPKSSISDYRRKGQIGGDGDAAKTGRYWHIDQEVPLQWDGPHFQNRLIHAYKTLAFTPMPKNSRPASYGSAWPQYSYKFEDLVAQADAEDEQIKADQNRRNFVRPRPTREQLTQMDMLFETVYSFRTEHPRACTMILSWAHGRYKNINMTIIADRFNVSKMTIYREINNLASLCSERLNHQTVRPW